MEWEIKLHINTLKLTIASISTSIGSHVMDLTNVGWLLNFFTMHNETTSPRNQKSYLLFQLINIEKAC
jgi:hypothetical protein